MTSQIARLYAFAGSLLIFFVSWAGIAAHPWIKPSASAAGPSVESLAAYQKRIQTDAALLQTLSAQTARRASTPAIRIVTLPPLTTTRTS
jgi:hypothetical protein